jgi:hypothetical protein
MAQRGAWVRDVNPTLAQPTSPRMAPFQSAPTDTIEVEYGNQAMRILCIAGLGGLPQISCRLGYRSSAGAEPIWNCWLSPKSFPRLLSGACAGQDWSG